MAEQNPYRYSQYASPQPQGPKMHLSWQVMAVIVIALLFVSAGIIFLVKPQSIAPSVQQTAGLSAMVVMASAIDDNYQYQAQPNNAYAVSAPLYLYVEAKGVKQKSDGSVDVSEDVEIKDAQGVTKFSKRGFGSNTQQFTEQVGSIKFSNVIPTDGFAPGEYFALIVIDDNVAGTSVSKTVQFSVQNGSTEEIHTTADLSAIATGTAHLVKIQKVTGPDGKVIPELSINQTVTQDLSNIDLSNIDVSFKMPEHYPAGTYTVEITYLNTDNGQSKSVKQSVTVTKQFAIDQFVFASSIDDNYQYVAAPNNAFNAGDVVNAYFRIVDFSQPMQNGTYAANMALDLSIISSDGTVVGSQPRYLVVADKNTVMQDAYNMKAAFKADLAPGSYTLRAVVHDENSGQMAQKEEVFIIQ